MKETKPNLYKLNSNKLHALKFSKYFLLLIATGFLGTGFVSTGFLITSAMAKAITKDKSVCINQASVIKEHAIADARAVNKTSQLNSSLQLDKYTNRTLINKKLAHKVLVQLSAQVDKNIHIKTLVKNPQKRITA